MSSDNTAEQSLRLRVSMSRANMSHEQATAATDGRASLATPEEFVRKYGGKRAINKILIANNGIAGT
jgi:acetyl-CoA carboxylase/biotin carboxylase 1